MNPMSRLATLLALASTILLLAHTVESCVNFQASWVAQSGPDSNKLNAELWDNGPKVCSLSGGLVASDGLFHLNCDTGFTATFHAVDNGAVKYTTKWGTFSFAVPYHQEQFEWYVCEYGCTKSECFVPV